MLLPCRLKVEARRNARRSRIPELIGEQESPRRRTASMPPRQVEVVLLERSANHFEASETNCAHDLMFTNTSAYELKYVPKGLLGNTVCKVLWWWLGS